MKEKTCNTPFVVILSKLEFIYRLTNSFLYTLSDNYKNKRGG
ncbi:hypothetical protein SAMN05216352_105100 [Alteribacillus bidgolensis]|uniref:Uncharacterized protein n=1 Tax=Alteribacillus bidgolensis TaxID=930129 RepID=A0A1G8I9U9_9BACI|nr:hypothetical protein SAMN05216352_105100 [Alteribacillus bidgolensis]